MISKELPLLTALFFSINICSFSCFPAGATDSKQETKQGLYIYQTSGIIGDQDIYATNNGIKIVNKSSGLVTVAAAPDWKVTTYHDNSRLTCQVPLSSFSGYIPKAAFEETGCRWDNLPLVKSEVKEVANLPSQVYTTSNNFTEKQLKDWQLQFADSKFIKSARYCVSSNLKLPDKALSVLCKFYGLAKKGGVPLEFKYHDLGGNLHTGLITTSQRSLKAESISLKAPEGYKTVSSPAALHKEVTASKNKQIKRRPLL